MYMWRPLFLTSFEATDIQEVVEIPSAQERWLTSSPLIFETAFQGNLNLILETTTEPVDDNDDKATSTLNHHIIQEHLHGFRRNHFCANWYEDFIHSSPYLFLKSVQIIDKYTFADFLMKNQIIRYFFVVK